MSHPFFSNGISSRLPGKTQLKFHEANDGPLICFTLMLFIDSLCFVTFLGRHVPLYIIYFTFALPILVNCIYMYLRMVSTYGKFRFGEFTFQGCVHYYSLILLVRD